MVCISGRVCSGLIASTVLFSLAALPVEARGAKSFQPKPITLLGA